MRKIEMKSVWTAACEGAVDVELDGNRHAVYVDAAAVLEVPALAILHGDKEYKSSVDGKLNDLLGHLRQNVEPFNVEGLIPKGGLEIFAVTNLEEVVQGGDPETVGRAGDRSWRPNRVETKSYGRKKKRTMTKEEAEAVVAESKTAAGAGYTPSIA